MPAPAASLRVDGLRGDDQGERLQGTPQGACHTHRRFFVCSAGKIQLQGIGTSDSFQLKNPLIYFEAVHPFVLAHLRDSHLRQSTVCQAVPRKMQKQIYCLLSYANRCPEGVGTSKYKYGVPGVEAVTSRAVNAAMAAAALSRKRSSTSPQAMTSR